MKVGDLVKFDEWQYPQYKGKIGVIAGSRQHLLEKRWKVYVKGRLHPYMVDEDSLEVVNETICR